MLSLARMLRRFAEEHNHDANRDLFLSTAMALEGRAHILANAPEGAPLPGWDTALHAPVNQLV